LNYRGLKTHKLAVILISDLNKQNMKTTRVFYHGQGVKFR